MQTSIIEDGPDYDEKLLVSEIETLHDELIHAVFSEDDWAIFGVDDIIKVGKMKSPRCRLLIFSVLSSKSEGKYQWPISVIYDEADYPDYQLGSPRLTVDDFRRKYKVI